ncbi:hypothetical protein BSL78_17983 [Apostichopus japonicus]|uniref:Aminotransferase class I/classII domain-containing protein n=1 Tax=Stichopus japonicus TaxID=307972 RepID=A0A2G8KAY7_STIJA|nr:hypothetical protein BSL78_17983 [Apostichopus japonicus]
MSKEKIVAMQQVFEEKLKGVIKYSLPEGGFFVWIQLPTNMNCDDLVALCQKKYNVTFACGNKFTKNPGSLSNFIRISFSHLEKDTFIAGVKELSDAILELQATNNSQ